MSQLNVDTITNAAGSGGQLSLANGDFNFDSNTLFVDTSADKVGVGTNAPVGALDVRGTGGVVLASSPLLEKVDVVSAEPGATTDIDILTAAVKLYTTASTANWTHNLRGNASTTLNSLMENGQVAVYTAICSLGASSGYTAAINIDGTSQTVIWNDGEAPSAAGATSGYDIFSFTIIKTASATFTVLGSVNTFTS
jgi:hypothetical protein